MLRKVELEKIKEGIKGERSSWISRRCSRNLCTLMHHIWFCFLQHEYRIKKADIRFPKKKQQQRESLLRAFCFISLQDAQASENKVITLWTHYLFSKEKENEEVYGSCKKQIEETTQTMPEVFPFFGVFHIKSYSINVLIHLWAIPAISTSKV